MKIAAFVIGASLAWLVALLAAVQAQSEPEPPASFVDRFWKDLAQAKWGGDAAFFDRWFATLPAAKMKRELKERKPEYADTLAFSLGNALIVEAKASAYVGRTVSADASKAVVELASPKAPNDGKLVFELVRKGEDWRIQDMHSEIVTALRPLGSTK